MKHELPCEIVKDLLPSYIDELAGADTAESVKAHLEGCEECQKVYENMKSEEDNTKPSEQTEEGDAEKKLYKKINNKIHKKVWIAIGVGLAAVLLTIGTVEFLYGANVKKVPGEEITVSAEVYSVHEQQARDLVDRLYVHTSEASGLYMDDMGYKVTNLDAVECITTVEMESTYILKEVGFWDTARVLSDGVLYIDCAETTLVNNRLPSGKYNMSLTCFGELEKIIYLDGDKEIVLWEKGQE